MITRLIARLTANLTANQPEDVKKLKHCSGGRAQWGVKFRGG